jgi:hypothetical protein
MQLENLRVEQAAIGGEAGARRVNKLVDEAVGKIDAGIDGNRLLESIRQLRRDAQAIRNAQKMGQAPSPERIAEAEAKLKIAASLENLAENNIFDPRFKDEFRQARTAMAKTYAYEDATNFNTGQVDPITIARLTQQDNALTGIIADIGAIAGNFPEIASSAPPSTLLQRAGTHLTRSGIGGTIGAGIGAMTPIGPIAGGVAGAGAAELYTGLRARKMATPEYQRRFAAPEDRRIFPTQVNELAPPTPGTPALYDWRNALMTEGEMPYRPNWVYGQPEPNVRTVRPEGGPPALPAPSPESTLGTLRAEDVRRAGVSRAIGQEAEARQAAAEAAARRPTSGEVVLDLDPVTGRLREASQGLKGATPETFQNFGSSLQSAAAKVTEGRKFDLTAAEKVAWERTKVDLAEVAPGMRALDDKAIAGKMMDRAWVDSAIQKAREKTAAFAQIEAKAKDAQSKRKAAADRERMQDLLETLEEQFRAGRPNVSQAQGPKTRAAQAAANPGRVNALMPDGQNRNTLNK